MLPLGVGHRRPGQELVPEGHQARILHRAHVELRHERLVVLVERVAHPEEPVQPVQALPGDGEDLLGVPVEMLDERAPAVEAERDTVVLGPAYRVRAGDQ
ncbi:hypothetical protein GCM10027615_77900 [Plantactinospora veratri]